MKKRKHLHTNFIQFLIEKHNQEISEEETNVSNKEVVDEFDKIINGEEDQDDEVQDELENEDELEKLVNEYKLLEKKYKLKSNDSIYNKRK